jgi:hypothetical protein
MSHLVEIAFKGNRKEFFLWDGDDPPRVRTTVIVEGDRGEDLGEVHAIGELAAKRWAASHMARRCSAPAHLRRGAPCGWPTPTRCAAPRSWPRSTRTRAAARWSACGRTTS